MHYNVSFVFTLPVGTALSVRARACGERYDLGITIGIIFEGI